MANGQTYYPEVHRRYYDKTKERWKPLRHESSRDFYKNMTPQERRTYWNQARRKWKNTTATQRYLEEILYDPDHKPRKNWWSPKKEVPNGKDGN